jgi:surfeit locus 1 family protein
MMRSRGSAFLLLTAAFLCAVFVALGTWQVQRMFWKHALIERTQTRIHAAPTPAPAPAVWPAVQAQPHDFEYLHVQLQGEFVHAQESLVQASTTQGAGFWVVTPLRLADGTYVLVNRGFVPPERRDPARRGAASPQGPVTVSGLLRISEPVGGFLRKNDPATQRWHSRDVPAIAAAHGLPADQVAPYFVDAGAARVANGSPAKWPIGGLTVVHFADSHLVYALTWYALAAMVLGAVFYIRRSAHNPAS